jgi:transposase-like protein
MSKSVLNAKAFQNEAAAYAWVEARVWPDGPVCPHCGGVERIGKMGGKSTRIGLYKCYQCRQPFTVKIGTVFEASHVPMHLWLQAVYLMCSSKKGISSNQLHRTLGVTLKTAWFMSHRLREAMRSLNVEPMGGAGKTVEIDETLQGRLSDAPKDHGPGYHFSFKNTVLALVERGGSARTFHVEGRTMGELLPILRANINPKSTVMTDEHASYQNLGRDFARHGSVSHSDDEYVRYTNAVVFPKGEPYTIHTNTVEGYFSVFKRGMSGVYQHCSEKHLHRYLSEFDFRYSNRTKLGIDDAERADRALKGIVGKRLTYRTTRQ